MFSSVFIVALMMITSIPETSLVRGDEDDVEDKNEEFFDACAEGNFDEVAKYIEGNPSLSTSISEEGESCMMLAAIEGGLDIVKLLVKHGGDINQRAEGELNHRMPVIGWHVLAGNVDTLEYLIEQGVDINPEFDGVNEEGEMFGIFTPLDLVDFMLDSSEKAEELDEESNELVAQLKLGKEILMKHGAKKFVGSMEF